MSEERKTRKTADKRQDTSLTFRLNPLLVEQIDALVPLFERAPATLAGASANRSAVARAALTYGVSHYLRKLRDEPPAAKVEASTPPTPTPLPEAYTPPTPSRAPALPETMLRYQATRANLTAAERAGDAENLHRLVALLTLLEAEEMPLAEQLDALRLERDAAKRDGADAAAIEALTDRIPPLKAKLAKLRQVAP
jgi:hypothetical protein